MPTNKNASIRYQALDKCFSDLHHRYYFEDLIKKCDNALLLFNGVGGVSRRQIFEDIKFMESEAGWNIPLQRIKEGRRTYYRYADPDFTINRQPLTQEEAEQLETVIDTLNRFHGILDCQWVEEIISNLSWRFNLKKHERKIIGFDQNPQLKGLQFLSLIIDATLHQHALQVVYHSYKSNAVETTLNVHPYFIKQYNNRWFLMGLDHDSGLICNLALDRMVKVEEAPCLPFIVNDKIDFDHYFDDVIGVTVPEADVEKIHIILQLREIQYAYVTAKPLHSSQSVVDRQQRIISIDVKPNYELDYHILALCPDIEVLSPLSYRKHIKDLLEESLEYYLK